VNSHTVEFKKGDPCPQHEFVAFSIPVRFFPDGIKSGGNIEVHIVWVDEQAETVVLHLVAELRGDEFVSLKQKED